MKLLEMSNSGGMEPEETTSSSQTGTPVDGWGHQTTFKIFYFKFFLCKTNAGKNVVNTEKKTSEHLEAQLGIHPITQTLCRHKTLTLLKILCFACSTGD